MLKEGNKTGIVGNPKALSERIILATECVSQYKFTMPMVIDGMDGKVNQDYQAAPVRVTVVDIDGKVAFYAGRGPADFRIPPVERTLKRLIANKGRMPPVPALQWGEPVNGLRCGLSFDPQKLSIGEEIIIRLRFENTTGRPIGLLYDPANVLGHIVISNDDRQTLKVEPLNADGPPQVRRAMARRADSIPLRRIGPGQAFDSEVEGRIIPGSREAMPAAGPFRAIYNLEVSGETLSKDEQAPARSLWTGRIGSGLCTLNVTSPRQ